MTSKDRRKARGVGIPAIAVLLLASLLFFLVGGFVGYIYEVNFVSPDLPAPSAKTARTAGSATTTARSNMEVPTKTSNVVKNLLPKTGEICTDTCKKAKNGVCDDGRYATKSTMQEVFCDLGTDCSDCGPWKGSTTMAMESGKGPMAFLKEAGVDVRVKGTKTVPSYLMPYTDPKKDLDVSDMVDRLGLIEAGITQIFHQVLKDRCVSPDGSRALVVDIGANFGYFTLYAASMGCRVIAWEPVPLFRAFVKYGLQINNLTHLVDLHERVVGEKDGEVMRMQVPTVGVWGTASVAGLNQFEAQQANTVEVKSERVDGAVKENVLLMKADVEGYESFVFKSAENLFKNYNVENIVMEYSPGVAERAAWGGTKSMLRDNPQMLVNIIKSGYKLVQMHDNYAKGGAVDWAAGLPPLPEVTLDNLKYDLRDVDLYAEGKMGCPIPEELRKKYPVWAGCNMAPEDVHPKSLRSMFPYNTNLWAAKDDKLMKVYGTVGVFNLDQPTDTTWTSQKDPGHGVGMRSCPHLTPDVLVRSRCSCTYASPDAATKCREEEELVMKLLKQGKLAFTDKLPA
eukprot:CAMPEP_0202902672 /NCGR_PEP_ID=MMETSP1392-20130828/16989_1 /ASSEMBLY_ACC=CAM_ASM_000868 /TAXON_ID=225041 /ORGANISM="Chlamydomonas chlamydogama, Strain SAG 11-48b" /LENGTH=567 /DNA_ID=CAMNT_0049589473 /DNA_START=195 /DNA_END=1898 /DNA_ORIENTATION=+